ncbi:nicotinate-nucleotide adenylyltransferase [Salmonella bongori]|nr:nicotinate-nucleotide adenylyltransferase [Salmonella bongori]
MLELAIADKPLFTLDERELKRNAPSYTAQTLKEWRTEQGSETPLAFIIGQDSLLNFPTWHDYDTILDNAHLIVCRRPGYPLEMTQAHHQRWLEQHLTHTPDDLHQLPAVKFIWRKRPGSISRRPSSANGWKKANPATTCCRKTYLTILISRAFTGKYVAQRRHSRPFCAALRLAPFDRVLCSELERARLTARLILKGRDVPQYRLSERNEIYFGDWAMCHHRELTHEDAESYAAWCTDWQNTIPTKWRRFFRHLTGAWSALSRGSTRSAIARTC